LARGRYFLKIDFARRAFLSAMGWIMGVALAIEALLRAAPVVAVFVLSTAIGGAIVEPDWQRAAIGLGAALIAPLILWALLDGRLKSLKRRAPHPRWFVPVVDAAIALGLGLGFADDAGRALRRRGDWFVGERNGLVARSYRQGLTQVAMMLERFDPPAELRLTLPPDPTMTPTAPPDPTAPPPDPTMVAWFHPLAGPERALPGNESRRFGAARPPPRPVECELGHCGVDLGTTLGEPVFAISEAIVERIERDEAAGGRAGRYVRLGHRDGTVVSRYIHLDSIRADLKEGARIKGGELIGRLGRTGVERSGAHLHFAISLRPAGRESGRDGERYVDPEPLLRRWQLPTAPGLPYAEGGPVPPGRPSMVAAR
jgi:hypothetical protein